MVDNLESKGIDNFPAYEGIQVSAVSFLPIRRRYELCDIITREVYFIEGEWIHVFYMNNKFYCSKEYFEKIKKEYPNGKLPKSNRV